MSSAAITITAAVLTAIESHRDNTTAWDTRTRFTGTSGFIINDFESERTSLPWHNLEDIDEKGKVWVIEQAASLGRTEVRSRRNTMLGVFPVMVSYQRLVRIEDQATIDLCYELVEQLWVICQHSVSSTGFQLTGIEPITDENDMPLSYMGLREASTFESYFTAYFNNIFP